jgi:agmatine deiminase
MPAETDRHERTFMAWPTTTRREELWRDELDTARAVYAAIAHALVAHEPVTVVAAPLDEQDARARCGGAVDVIPMPIDDAWLRDTGPIVVCAPDGGRHAIQFGFNAWGGKYEHYENDATIGARLANTFGLPVHDVTMVFEGGSIAVDGAGRLVTTERCLLNPNRNPQWSRDDIETALRAWLGVDEIVWLRDGIVEDEETDGHVDNVVAFCAPGRALLQGCSDPDNPNHAVATANRVRLEAAGIEVVEVPWLPYASVAGTRVPVSYVNFYVGNGVVVAPVTGATQDDDMLGIIAAEHQGRELVAVPGSVLAYGGGGVHCITQQLPACAGQA